MFDLEQFNADCCTALKGDASHKSVREVVARAVTDPAYVGDVDWEDRTIEVVETAEQALVDKTARVVEEISLKKVGSERVETVHEKLRRQQMEIAHPLISLASGTQGMIAFI